MTADLTGVFLGLVLPAVALWLSADHTETFPDLPGWAEPVLRLVAVGLAAAALLSTAMLGLAVAIRGYW